MLHSQFAGVPLRPRCVPRMRLLVAGAAIASAGGDAAVSLKARGPQLAFAEQWYGTITESLVRHGNPQPSETEGAFIYDLPGRRHRWERSGSLLLLFPYFTEEEVVVSAGAEMLNVSSESVCKPSRAAHVDPFGWLATARPNGSEVVGGEPCQRWISEEDMAVRTVCIAKEGLPRTWTEVHKGKFTAHRLFKEMVVGAAPEHRWAPTACTTNYPAAPCKLTGADEASEVLTLYRYQNGDEPLNVSNRRMMDSLGAALDICTGNASHSEELVTMWEVEVSTAWGQFGYCRKVGDGFTGEYACFDDELATTPSRRKQVGREAAANLGSSPACGQCSANRATGSWYSLFAGAQCPEGAALGTDGCSWRAARHLRTVDLKCILRDRAMAEACAQLSGPPFTRPAEIFARAVASGDVHDGGCGAARTPDSPYCQDHAACRMLHPIDKICCPVANGVMLSCCLAPEPEGAQPLNV